MIDDDDRFTCTTCGDEFDIEDSVRDANKELHCSDCADRST